MTIQIMLIYMMPGYDLGKVVQNLLVWRYHKVVERWYNIKPRDSKICFSDLKIKPHWLFIMNILVPEKCTPSLLAENYPSAFKSFDFYFWNSFIIQPVSLNKGNHNVILISIDFWKIHFPISFSFAWEDHRKHLRLCLNKFLNTYLSKIHALNFQLSSQSLKLWSNTVFCIWYIT